jgi:hypothetical protein
MSKVWLAKIEKGKVAMEEYVQDSFHDWCAMNEGKQIRITPHKKPVSRDMRAYYFSAVIPLLKSTCDEWKDLNSLEMHEVSKKMFCFFETYNPITKRTERFGRSVMSDSEFNNTAKAQEYLMKISDYLADCGLSMPDSEEYKKFLDSAPMINEKRN